MRTEFLGSLSLFAVFALQLSGLSAAEKPLLLPVSAKAYLPTGSKLVDLAYGDLNADGKADLVFLRHETDPRKITTGEDGYVQDDNPRVLVVLLAHEGGYLRLREYPGFVPPYHFKGYEMWDEVYEGMKIRNGVLSLNFYWYSTKGTYWVSREEFKFRLEAGRMRWIGFEDETYHRGSGDKYRVSVNFLTGRQKNTEGLHHDVGLKTNPKVSWRDLPPKPPLYLETLSPCDRKEAPPR